MNEILDLEQALIPVRTVRVLMGMRNPRLLGMETRPDEMGLIDSCQRVMLKVSWDEPKQGYRVAWFDLETGTYMGDAA